MDVVAAAHEFVVINMYRDDILTECCKRFRLCERLAEQLVSSGQLRDPVAISRL